MDLKLREIRKRKKLSQTELADLIGVKLRTIGSWERGETVPNIEQAWNCAVVLGCSINDLCGWPDSKNEQNVEDSGLKSLSDSYESMNDDGKAMLVSVAKSLKKDPENQITYHAINFGTGKEIKQLDGDENVQ